MKNVKAPLFIITILSASLASHLAWSAPVAATIPAKAQQVSGELRFLPATTPEQKEVRALILNEQFDKALAQWNSAFGQTAFANSASGYAFFSYLMFKAGLEVSSVEHLFLLKEPSQISPDVRVLWQQAAHPNHDVWKLVSIRWSSAWKAVFAGFSGLENAPFQPATLKTAAELKKLQVQVAQTKPNTNERAWAQWQVALWGAVFNQTALAKSQLDEILRSKQSVFDADQIHMAKARILYQEGDLKTALSEYSSIKKSSDYWLESLEERAWTYMRAGQPDKSLGELKTLLAPVFSPQVGPEPFFLQAFVNLKICDFPQIFKTLEEFKKRYRARAIEIQALAETGKTPAAQEAIAKLDRSTLTWNSVGVNSMSLPRYFHRDEVIAKEMGLRQNLLRDSEKIQAITRLNPGAFSGPSFANRNLNSLSAKASERAEQARSRVFRRLQTLAQIEVKEMAEILQKMKIIEAEAIERMHLVQQAHQKAKAKPAVAVSDDQMIFPVRSDEVWADEYDKFQYDIKGCPNQQGKAL